LFAFFFFVAHVLSVISPYRSFSLCTDKMLSQTNHCRLFTVVSLITETDYCHSSRCQFKYENTTRLYIKQSFNAHRT